MEGRVPGGRQRSATSDDLTADVDEQESGLANGRLNQQHRHVSQSLPRFSPDPRKVDSIPDDLNRSQTLDRRKKLRGASFRSFGHFVQRMVRHMSQVSLHAPSPKLTKRSFRVKNPGVNKEDPFLTSRSSFHFTDTSRSGVDSPLILHFDKGKIPGILGIRNHGNTCFMNAVLQCLSHTELVVEYFVTNQYKHDIKRTNKQNSKKFGTKGELTESLAYLLKSLWTSQYTGEISSEFKSIVGKYGSQYKGYAQHDAQEFLVWLLDKVHEDLNIAAKKKYRANKSSHGRSDEAVAAEALANHMRCNNSFVYDLFQALYRSSLICPNCRRQSNTFDPFLYVSLPIPQKSTKPVYVTVVYLDAQPKQVRIGLLMNQSDNVKQLRRILGGDTKIPESQLILTEIYYDGFHRTFHDTHPLGDVHETDNIYAIEAPQPVEEGQTQYAPSRYITLVVLNKLGIGTQGRRFGGPIVLQVPRNCSFMDLQNDILHNMTGMLRDGIIAQKMGVLFRLRVVDGLPGKCYLPHEVENPLYMPTIDRALSNCVTGGGPQHLKLIVEWDQQTKQCMIANSDDLIEEHESVRQVRTSHDQPVLGTLDECFRLYTEEERLQGENAWHCPNCRRQQQGTIKKLSLWSLPDILVVHLKRFKQIDVRRTKLNTLITFPVIGLDMSHHVADRKFHTPQIPKSGTGWSPWRPHRKPANSSDDHLYDLYAVCNHYGNMQGGHYTAFCKNPLVRKWYTFDDTKVTEMAEQEVVTRAAYLLFYRRRTVLTADVNDPTHWIHKVHKISYRTPKQTVSKSHEDLLDDNASSFVGDHSFSRNVEANATLRPATRVRSSTTPVTLTTSLENSLAPSTPPAAESERTEEAAKKPTKPEETKTNEVESNKGPLEASAHASIPLEDIIGEPVTRGGRTRAATVPTVTSPTKDPSCDKTPKKTPDVQNWNYSRTIYLQESCV